MFQSICRHVRSNVVAYIALFIAISGTAYAAAELPPNSVGTRQLQSGAVTGQKVAKNTLTGANLKESTLGTVPNSSHLGGSPASKYQREIAGECNDPAADAISIVAPDGSVRCGPTNITQMMGGSGSATISGAHEFLAPEGISTPTATRANAEVASSGFDATGDHLYVEVSTAPGASSDWTFQVVVNGVATSLGCTVAPAATTCISQGGTADISQESRVALEASAIGSPAPAQVVFGWTDTH